MLENQLILPNSECIDTFQLEMLTKNRIPGILPIAILNEEICVDTKGYMPLKSYLESHTLTIKTFKMMLECFLSIMEDSLLYYLNWSNYLLSCEHIFISVDIQSIALVYMPIESQVESNPIRAFITQIILLNGKFNTEEDWNFMILGLNTLNSMSMKANQLEILYEVFQLRSSIVVEPLIDTTIYDEGIKNKKSTKYKKNSGLTFIKKVIKEKSDTYIPREENTNNGKTILLKESNKGVTLVSKNTKQPNITLSDRNVVFGRNKKSVDILLKDPSIGKCHAEIIYEDGRYYIRDLNSLNGTFVNGKKLPSYETKELHSTDNISFAVIEFEVNINE